PDEEAGERALQAVRFHRAAGGGDLGEQRRHGAPLGCLGELQPVQRGSVLRKMAIEVGEASWPQLGLLANEVGLQRHREGLVCPRARLGAIAGGILTQPDAGIEVRGGGARLRHRDRGHLADGDARLALAAAVAEDKRRAMGPQAYAEAGNIVVPFDVLGLAGRQHELGDAIFGELHVRAVGYSGRLDAAAAAMSLMSCVALITLTSLFGSRLLVLRQEIMKRTGNGGASSGTLVGSRRGMDWQVAGFAWPQQDLGINVDLGPHYCSR